jgi:hypothetical protein
LDIRAPNERQDAIDLLAQDLQSSPDSGLGASGRPVECSAANERHIGA